MINLEILGKFYDNHSLSLINRQLATHLNNCKDFDVFLTKPKSEIKSIIPKNNNKIKPSS